MARSTRRGRGAALGAALVTVALLAACGGGAEDENDDADSSADPGSAPDGTAPDGAEDPTAPPESSSEGTAGSPETPTDGGAVPEEVLAPELEGYADLSGQTIEIATRWTGSERDRFDQVLDAFEQATGARVDQLGLGGNPVLAITESLDNGRPPNVAVVGSPTLVRSLAEDGAIVPLAEEVRATIEDSYAPTWTDLGSVDGDVYAVWMEATSKSLLWYDAAAYADAGVEEPATWDDLLAGLRELSGTDVAPVTVGVDYGWPLTDWFENAYLRLAGPEAYDQLVDREIPWTDPSVVETLEVLAEVWGDPELVLSGGLDRSYPDTVENVFSDDPSAATLVGGEYVAGSIEGQTDAVVGEDAMFFPWPEMDGSAPTVVGEAGGAVAFDSEPGTAELMRYLASPEAANIWIALGGTTSPNQRADLDLYEDDLSREIAQQIVGAEVFRLDLSDLVPPDFGASQLEGLWPVLIDFYEDPSDPAATAQALEDAAADVYGD
ncbi:ABC transporter substrate-binding protein [Georgenia sp. Z1344]|uniref:ABC transporter substrate-binding protein n=1 Tax=Georgenia sp. Z1344 TaxID=3416706 RepID=UPI003CFA1FD6